ncbi:MAG: RlmE family RNA methyltransferase [Pseudomonadota bacterium]
MTQRRKPDYYTRLAHKKSYPARSVFKLEEIDARARLMTRGNVVLDLGASPGSWLMYLSEKAGNEGRVIGVDINPLNIELPQNAGFIQADVNAVDPSRIAEACGGRPIDVVVSDLAPRTSGVKLADQENSWALFERALELAAALLRPGGNFAGKLFFSPRHKEAETRLKGLFRETRTIHPRATRKSSREVFLVGKGFK